MNDGLVFGLYSASWFERLAYSGVPQFALIVEENFTFCDLVFHAYMPLTPNAGRDAASNWSCMLTQFRNLVPVIREGRRIGRSASFVDSQPVVVFQKSGSALCADDDYDWPDLLTSLDCGPVVELEQSDWPWSREAAVNFNCHAMAIGSNVGISPRDWLEGVASDATMHRNPTAIILRRFFELTAVRQPNSPQPDQVREDDVFVFYNAATDHFIHSGFIRCLDGVPVAVSKFGEGPILLTSLQLIGRFYSGQYDQIRWYRHLNTPR